MISISLTSAVPLHDQLVTSVRALIASGAVPEQHELPPVRQLAADLGINFNTVARAYRTLTDMGLIMTARGRGTIVISSTERPQGRPAEERRRIEQALHAALADARLAGFAPEDIRAIFDAQVRALWKAAPDGAVPRTT